jgi:predicted nucleic acid-binding protein
MRRGIERMSVYDALLLAPAREFDCPLVTADSRAFGSIPPDVAQVRLVVWPASSA